MTNEDENDDALHAFDEEAFFDETPSEEADLMQADTFETSSSFGDKIKAWSFPLIVGGGIAAFAGFKLYSMFAPSQPVVTKAPVATFKDVKKPATDTTQKTPAPPLQGVADLPVEPSSPAPSAAAAPALVTPAPAATTEKTAEPAVALPGFDQLKAEGALLGENVPSHATPSPVLNAAPEKQVTHADPLKQLLDDPHAEKLAPIATPETQAQTFNTLNQYWEREQKEAKIQEKINAPAAPEKEVPPAAPQADNEALTQKISDMSEGIEKLNDSLSALEKTIQTITNDVNTVKKMQRDQSNQIMEFSDQLAESSHASSSAQQAEASNKVSIATRNMPNVAKSTTATPQPVDNKSLMPPANAENIANEYSIEAVIPGRAWLRTADGLTVTVTEGDPLGNLGKVIMIDAQNGSLVTSSGIVLRN